MASDHDTGNACPRQTPTAERRLTVGTRFYDYPPRRDDPPGVRRPARPVPWLQLRGDWLAAAGFGIGARVRVRVTHGCLVLTLAEG